MPTTVAEKAAAQLPHEIGEHLRRVAHEPGEPVSGERMSSEDFFHRVADRAGTSYPKAIHEARCVIEVADEATGGALGSQIRPSLDKHLETVLFAGSNGHT